MQRVRRIVRERVAMAPKLDRSRNLLDAVRVRASKTIWITGGCKSWYFGKNGVSIVNSATLKELAADLRAPDYADYEVWPLPTAG